MIDDAPARRSCTDCHAEPADHEPLPRMDDLGRDLLSTTLWQRRMALARPAIGLAVYALAIYYHLWLLAPLIIFWIFVAVVTVTHDIVHGTIGLNARQTEWGLFFMGAFLLESGHAYRATHQQHHRVFPGPDDPEGDPARLTTLQSILYGPVFIPKLWLWSYRRMQGNAAQRRWLAIEASLHIIAVIAALLTWSIVPGFALYVAGVVVGSWVYPLLTVHLPHKDYGDTELTQTHTLRGVVIPAIFLELTYHLEHHLYPQVPSHNLPKLAKRLDPFFERSGVEPWHVP